MRVTKTIRPSTREAIAALVSKLPEGYRVTVEEPEATEPQQVKMRIMFDELARGVEWYGEKLVADDWKVIFLAGLRSAHVVHGFVPGTRVVLFGKRRATPSANEASQIITMLYQFAAERGFQFKEKTNGI